MTTTGTHDGGMDVTDEIKEIGSREFQINYQRITEPVKVVALNAAEHRVIGYFFPGRVDPRVAAGEWPRHEDEQHD